jgi:hypothetical protein
MDALQYQMEHFQFMSRVAERLSELKLEFRSHTYDYDTFGSWFFIFRKAGRYYRVIYDGRDYYLALQIPRQRPTRRWSEPWSDVASSKSDSHLPADRLIEATFSLISEDT